MPSQHSKDKINVSVWVGRPLHARLVKDARAKGFAHLTEYLEAKYVQATRHVELSAEDYRKIADDTARAERRLRKKKIKKNPA